MTKYLDPVEFVRLQREFISGTMSAGHRYFFYLDTGKPAENATEEELAMHWATYPDLDRCGAAWFGRKFAMRT